MIGQLAQPPPIRVGCGRVLVSNNNMEREGGNSSVGCRLLCVCHGLLRSRQITNPRNFMCKPASLHPPHHSRQAQLLVPGRRGSHPLAWIRYSRSHEGTECSASPEHQQSEICFIPWEADLGRCCLLSFPAETVFNTKEARVILQPHNSCGCLSSALSECMGTLGLLYSSTTNQKASEGGTHFLTVMKIRRPRLREAWTGPFMVPLRRL